MTITRRLSSSALLLAAAMPPAGTAQTVPFKNFKTYPTGHWTSISTTTQNGRSMGDPQFTSSCTGPIEQLAHIATPTAGDSCAVKVLADQPTLLEYEETCGKPPQSVHTKVEAINARTINVEVHTVAPGFGDVLTREHAVYAGAGCPAPVPRRAATNPSCAELASKLEGIYALGITCGTLPNPALCRTQTAAARQATIEQQKSCR